MSVLVNMGNDSPDNDNYASNYNFLQRVHEDLIDEGYSGGSKDVFVIFAVNDHNVDPFPTFEFRSFQIDSIFCPTWFQSVTDWIKEQWLYLEQRGKVYLDHIIIKEY